MLKCACNNVQLTVKRNKVAKKINILEKYEKK